VNSPDTEHQQPGHGVDCPPETGFEHIDLAVAELSGLPDAPLAEHGERLARAHAALNEALSSHLAPPEYGGSHDQDNPARP
jgi:hypothetical protein